MVKVMDNKPIKIWVEDVLESVYIVLAADISRLIVSSCVDSAYDHFWMSLKKLQPRGFRGIYFLSPLSKRFATLRGHSRQ